MSYSHRLWEALVKDMMKKDGEWVQIKLLTESVAQPCYGTY